jgi:hypothetical protein
MDGWMDGWIDRTTRTGDELPGASRIGAPSLQGRPRVPRPEDNARARGAVDERVGDAAHAAQHTHALPHVLECWERRGECAAPHSHVAAVDLEENPVRRARHKHGALPSARVHSQVPHAHRELQRPGHVRAADLERVQLPVLGHDHRTPAAPHPHDLHRSPAASASAAASASSSASASCCTSVAAVRSHPDII